MLGRKVFIISTPATPVRQTSKISNNSDSFEVSLDEDRTSSRG